MTQRQTALTAAIIAALTFSSAATGTTVGKIATEAYEARAEAEHRKSWCYPRWIRENMLARTFAVTTTGECEKPSETEMRRWKSERTARQQANLQGANQARRTEPGQTPSTSGPLPANAAPGNHTADLPASDRCSDLAAKPILVTDNGTGALVFEGTGDLGQLRQRGRVTLSMIAAAAKATLTNQRVERIAISQLGERESTVIARYPQAWLLCSWNKTGPLTHAIEGRFSERAQRVPTLRSRSRYIGVTSADGSCAPLSSECEVFDWLTANP